MRSIAVEESLYDSVSMRQFVGIDLGREAAPDETTVCKSGICVQSVGPEYCGSHRHACERCLIRVSLTPG